MFMLPRFYFWFFCFLVKFFSNVFFFGNFFKMWMNNNRMLLDLQILSRILEIVCAKCVCFLWVCFLGVYVCRNGRAIVIITGKTDAFFVVVVDVVEKLHIFIATPCSTLNVNGFCWSIELVRNIHNKFNIYEFNLWRPEWLVLKMKKRGVELVECL